MRERAALLSLRLVAAKLVSVPRGDEHTQDEWCIFLNELLK